MTKILAICSAIDLSEATGSTPAWWQLFKALSELDCEIIVIPYRGRSFDTVWWRSYPNPVEKEAKIADMLIKAFVQKPSLSLTSSKKLISQFYANIARSFLLHKWFKLLRKVFSYERGIDVVLMIQIPLNHLVGLPSFIHNEFNIPVFYYDGDMPTNLYGSFTVNYYLGANIEEYDGFIINSKGSEERLKRLGAKNIKTIYWGVDPELFKPLRIPKTYDIFFFGAGPQGREKDFKQLFIKPAESLPYITFTYAGGHGIWSWPILSTPNNVKYLGETSKIRFTGYKRLCCSSKINLNITRSPHKDVYASSVSRLFELAALECCIVSNACVGIEEWFKVGKEVFVAHDSKEAIELYKYLLDNEEIRIKSGELARERVLREHTSQHRAKELLDFIKSYR